MIDFLVSRMLGPSELIYDSGYDIVSFGFLCSVALD